MGVAMSNNKIKVLFISLNDWANSGYRYSQAVNKYSDQFEVKYFVFNEHPFGYNRKHVLIDAQTGAINNEAVNLLQEWNDECDIIHCKENAGFIGSFNEVKFDLSKPIVQTFGGSVYRKYHKEVREKTDGTVNVYTVTTPDLNFSDEILVPLPIDMEKYQPINKSSDCIIIGHSTTNRDVKGTDEIMDVLGRICERYPNAFVNIQEGIKFHYAVELKRINHIFIDQIKAGYYSNSAVEAMALGSAVVAKSNYGADGVIDADDRTLFEILSELIEDKDKLLKAQMRAIDHCERTHDFPVISQKLERVYNLALENE